MRPLIITQTVDSEDQALGFFLDWIKEFAKNCEKVTVICLKKGNYDLPDNVSVYSLGKEEGESRIRYIRNFYSYIYSQRNEYDSVFVHMNYIYALMGGLLWKIWSKKVGMWYVHREKGFGLWLSKFFVNTIFTSSPESFGYKSNKVEYMGHGVDNTKFICNNIKVSDRTKIVHIGRITPIKNLETLVLATEILHKKIPSLSVEFIGQPVTRSDKKYFEQLQITIKRKKLGKVVTFKGLVPNALIAKEYCDADLSVNLAPTGGWDKAVIESIMAKCPVFASNLGLRPVFGEYSDIFLFRQNDPLDLANKVEAFLAENDKDLIVQNLRTHAINEYDLKNLIKKISAILSK